MTTPQRSLSEVAHAVRHAPTEQEGREAYARMMRVRRWDRSMRAGWVPLASGGRKRSIAPTP